MDKAEMQVEHGGIIIQHIVPLSNDRYVTPVSYRTGRYDLQAHLGM